MDTLEVLMAARGEVEKGWCQHALQDGNGNVCLLGALNRVEMGDARSLDQSPYLDGYYAIKRSLPDGWDFPHNFNNHPSTSQADVLAVFDRAINNLVPVGDSSHVHRTVA